MKTIKYHRHHHHHHAESCISDILWLLCTGSSKQILPKLLQPSSSLHLNTFTEKETEIQNIYNHIHLFLAFKHFHKIQTKESENIHI